MYERSIQFDRSLPYNLLVVSDLHLSDDGDTTLDKEFADFLDSHRKDRSNGKPWRLVFAGDTFEFVGITEIPSDTEAAAFGIKIGKEEARFGLKSSPNETLWKIDRIVKTHEMIFKALSEFIGAGNQVVFINGNHDAELYWGQVQGKLKEVFASYLPNKSAIDLEPQVEFKPWADYEPGLYWIEHGSQYESYNSFWDPIVPADPKKPDHIQYQFAVLALYYFANHMTKFTEHFIGIWKYFYTLFKGYGIGAPLVLLRYVYMVLKIMARYPDFRKPPKGRDQNINNFASSNGIDPVNLDAVCDLWRRPVMAEFPDLLRASYFDKFILVLVGLVCLFGILFSPWEVGTKVVVCLVLGIAAYALIHVLHSESLSSVYAYARDVATEINQLLNVPFVIFGHNHHPVHYDIPGGPNPGWYINVGAWTSQTTGRDDHEGAVKSMSRFTYFRCIEQEKGVLVTELLHSKGKE